MCEIAIKTLDCAFRDEDPEVWIDAAVSLGQLRNPLPFLQYHLSTTKNIHAHRHAWCALASFVQNHQPGDDTRFEIVVRREPDGSDFTENAAIVVWLEERISAVVLLGLKNARISVGETAKGVRQFRKLRADNLARNETIVRSLNEDQKEQKGRLIAQRTHLENDSTLISQIHLPLPSPHWDSWSFGCFVASASPELLERLGISTNLVLHAMLCLSERGGDWFAFLLNAPKMLGRIIGEPPLRKERLTRWGRILVDHPHAPANKSIQWWQYPACRLWRTASTPRAHDPKCAHCWSRRVATYGQVFPCGIPSMFVEMFFVSAIFKRIMHKGKSEITVTERPVKPYKKAKVK